MREKLVLRDLKEILDPIRTALLLIDMQNDFVSENGAFYRAGRDLREVKEIIPECEKILSLSRETGVLVIHVRQCTLPEGLSDGAAWSAFKMRDKKSAEYAMMGSQGADPVPELKEKQGEIVISKFRPSAFHGTFLDQILSANGIHSVLIAGNNAEGCVLATVFDASGSDYYVCVAEEAVGSSVPGMKEAAMAIMKKRFHVLKTEEICHVWAMQK